jgi:hypothetical protein
MGMQETTLRITAETLLEAHGDLQALAEADKQGVERLIAAAPQAVRTLVPFFDKDVHQVEGLAKLREYLFA